MKATDVMINLGSAGTAKAGAGAKLSAGIRQATATKSTLTKSDASSFERTLGDAQASRAQSAKADSKGTAAQADGNNVRDDVKNTPKEPAQDKAAKTDGAQIADAEKAVGEAAEGSTKVEAKSGGKGNAGKSGKESAAKEDAGMQESSGTVKATALDAMLASLAGAAAAAGENTIGDATLAETEALSELTQTAMKFETLLPQSADDANRVVQNDKLMDMLNSMPQTVKPTELKAAPELTQLAQQALAAQQNTEGDAEVAQPAVIVQPGTAAGLGDVRTAAVNDTSKPQAAFAQVFAQRSAQQHEDRASKAEPGALESLFGASEVSVEHAVAMPDASNAAQQQLREFLQGQSEPETTGGSAPLKQGEQLPENADFDAAVRTDENMSQQPLSGAQNVMNMQAPVQAADVQPSAQQPVQDPYRVMQQIVDQARLIRSAADTEMVIKLNPQHLGELTLRVSVTAEGAVNASFHTDNPQVRGLIESSMIQLKQDLQAQGVKVNNVEVYSGLSQDFFAGSQAGQQGFAQQGSSQNAQPGALRMAAFEADAETLSVSAAVPSAAVEGTPSAGAASGVDYKV